MSRSYASEILGRMSLAVTFPTVAATWDREANPASWTPENTPPKSSYRARWRCAAGHTWEDSVSVRTSSADWKRGDIAACRVCVGYHVIHDYECGHRAEVLADSRVGRDLTLCPECRKDNWKRQQAARKKEFRKNSEKAKQLYADVGDEAGLIVDQIIAGAVVPDSAPLFAKWRPNAVHRMRFALIQKHGFDKHDSVASCRRQLEVESQGLMPSEDIIRHGLETGRPFTFMGKAHWPLGWAFRTGMPCEAPVTADNDQSVRELRAVLPYALQWADERGINNRKLRTILLTAAVNAYAYARMSDRYRLWVARRELTIPISPGDARGFGQLDVTVSRPGLRDLVIEIDSAHNAASIEKLHFAQAAGAVTVWVRWHGGRIRDVPEGVAVIDLRTP